MRYFEMEGLKQRWRVRLASQHGHVNEDGVKKRSSYEKNQDMNTE
jgi:hypothetical protein